MRQASLDLANDALVTAVEFYFEETTAQEVNRLTQLSHSTKIDGIASALHALGKRLDLRAL